MKKKHRTVRLVVRCRDLAAAGLWDADECCASCHEEGSDVLVLYPYRDYDVEICCAAAMGLKGRQANLSLRRTLHAMGFVRYPGNGRVIPRNYYPASWLHRQLWDGDILERRW